MFPMLPPDAMDNLAKSNLLQIRDLWFHRLEVSTKLVVIGLVMELPELAAELWHIGWRIVYKYWHKIKFPEESAPDWAKAIAFVGWAFIVVGVWGELSNSAKVSAAEGNLQTFNGWLLSQTGKAAAFANEHATSAYERAAQSERETAQENERAAQARKEAEVALEQAKGFQFQIAQANERAANAERESSQLRKDAESERLARVQIESRVAWRRLTSNQKRDIGVALTRFGRKPTAGFSYNGCCSEAEMFADDIAEALQAAGIMVQPPNGIIEMRSGGPLGGPIQPLVTGVIVSATMDDVAQDIADSLAKELNLRGFDTVRHDGNFDKKAPSGIWVMVEPRPEGPQGEFKLSAEREATAKPKK